MVPTNWTGRSNGSNGSHQLHVVSITELAPMLLEFEFGTQVLIHLPVTVGLRRHA